MTDEHTLHIAIAPVSNPSLDQIMAVAKILKVSQYDVRLRLKSPIPHSITKSATLDEAERLSAALRAEGLTTITYDKHRLPPAEAFQVHKLLVRESRLDLFDRHEHCLKLNPALIETMVIGRRATGSVRVEMDAEAQPISRGSYVTQPALPTGDHDAELFIMLFTDAVEQSPIEFRQHHIDYSFLGSRRDKSSQRNFEMLQVQLESMMPNVMRDNRLMHSHGDSPVANFNQQMGDSATATATLLHWQRLAEKRMDQGLTIAS